MPAGPTLEVFLLVAFAVSIFPGPAVLYITARSVAQGRRAGLVSMMGVELASLTHVVAATLGLSALVMTSALLFSVVKDLGAAYLILLGVRTLLANEDDRAAAGPIPRRFSRLFAQGFVVNLLNPKVALFFFAFLPQFVDPARGAVAGQILLLGTLYVALVTCTDSLYALLGGTVGRWLGRHARFRQNQRYVTGSVYIGLGLTAALAGAEKR